MEHNCGNHPYLAIYTDILGVWDVLGYIGICGEIWDILDYIGKCECVYIYM